MDEQQDYDMSIHTNPSALAWAKFYTETKSKSNNPENFDNEDNMVGWFANAMQAMYDSVYNRVYYEMQKVEDIMKNLETNKE